MVEATMVIKSQGNHSVKLLIAANVLLMIVTWFIAPWPMVWFGSFGFTVCIAGAIYLLSTEPDQQNPGVLIMHIDDVERAVAHVLRQPGDLGRVDYEAWESAQALARWAKGQIKSIERRVQDAHNESLAIDEPWLKSTGFTENDVDPGALEMKGLHYCVVYHGGMVTIDHPRSPDEVFECPTIEDRGQMVNLLNALDMFATEQPEYIEGV